MFRRPVAPFFRRLLTLVSILSLLLCALVCWLWSNSYIVRDDIGWSRISGHGPALQIHQFGIAAATGRIDIYYTCLDRMTPDIAKMLQAHTPGGLYFRRTKPPVPPVSPEHFLFRKDVQTLRILSDTTYIAGAPAWLIALITLLLSSVKALNAWKNRATIGPRCATCGYDLRATLDRCPECGTVPQPIALPA